jgi:hypothetical protein
MFSPKRKKLNNGPYLQPTTTDIIRRGITVCSIPILVIVYIYLSTAVHIVDGDKLRFQVPETTLLSTPDFCSVTTDVRGNLGSGSVLLFNKTDWLKDRWQAASDMHGTQIQGPHWVQFKFKSPVVLNRILLDWESAYSDHYEVLYMRNAKWQTIFKAPSSGIRVTTSGRSPGVEEAVPLHYVHEFSLFEKSMPTTSMRLLIKKSNTGWGVSLWYVEIHGTKV